MLQRIATFHMLGAKIMVSKIKILIQDLVGIFGYKITKITLKEFPKDMDKEFKRIYEEYKDYTMTSIERMYALYKAVEYVMNSKIPGDFVECGVWRGGSSMIMAHTLLKLKETNRKIYLYDTFEGMPRPTEKDKEIIGSKSAIDIWEEKRKNHCHDWFVLSLNEVKNNMLSTGYLQENIIFVKGKVEDTIPGTTPSQIALLRLDTDWYESTYHELKHLFPLLSDRGILIIDDYGHWAGAKEAVDKYFKENNITILLNRIDYTGRLGIKLGKES